MIPDAIREEILLRLREIERIEGVRIIHACESGSRAWGFPSPDSDYDVRFIYARPRADYLRLAPVRDVIERDLDGDLDLTGWDVRKAMMLLLKSNAIAGEWLTSPITYVTTEKADILRDYADTTMSVDRVRRHYHHLAESIWKERLGTRDTVEIKKYFYVLRPALALRHLRLADGRPPMHVSGLLETTDLSVEMREVIENLIQRKLVTREMGRQERIPAIDDLVVREMEMARQMFRDKDDVGPGPRDDAVFLSLMER